VLTDRQRDALPALGVVNPQVDAPLAPLTRLGIGGVADALVEVPDPAVLALLARWTRRERLALTPLQLGTDQLVLDGGVRGVVFVLGQAWRRVEQRGDVFVLGGEASAADVTRTLGAAPAWLHGADGGVGAALVGREPHGALGVRSLDVVLGRGVQEVVPSAALKRRARRLGLRDEAVVASVELEVSALGPFSGAPLPPRGPGVRLFLDPPSGSTAGDLLERSGLLGVRVRGVRIHEAEPNRLIAEEGATARDVRVLADWAISKVAVEWGVRLRLALRTLGSRT